MLINTASRSLEDIAEESGYKLQTAQQIARGSYIQEIGSSEEFSQVAFSLNVGDTGGPAKTQKGYALIRVNALKPINQEKFLEDKNAIREKLINEKKQKSFQNWFSQLKKESNLRGQLLS